MIKIQLGERFLDTYAKEQVELSWEGFRFMKALRAGYTNDIKIPKTTNNLDILGAVGLLDSQTQMFGTKTVRGILQLEVRVLPVFIQVCSVDKNEIGICIYEDSFPEAMKDKKLHDYVVDNNDTILPWNYKTLDNYSQWFREYNYGMPYDTKFAQKHPVWSVNGLISILNSSTGYNMPAVNSDWVFMATRKKVCPQNHRQMIEGRCDFTTDSGRFMLSGGNHITNDLDIHYGENGQYTIEFNRNCNITMTFWLAWKSKATAMSGSFIVSCQQEGAPVQNRSYHVDGDVFRNNVNMFTWTFNAHAGDSMNFNFIAFEGDYTMCNFLCDATITNYQITSDDYDNDLSYNYCFPKLVYWDWEDNKEKTVWWDGSSFTVHSKKKNVSSLFTTTYQTGYRSLSYFGLWANVPNFKLCDFWFSMQWLYGARLTFDHQTTVVWENADQYSLIEGEILEIRPKSDKLGQKNYIQFNDEEEPLEISSIQNQWLQEKNTFHKSTFGMVDSYTSYIVVKQYSNPEHDPDSTEYKCDFNDINSLVIVRDDGTNLKKIELKDFNLNTLVQSMEVTIKTFTPQLRDKDYIFLDGRKYMIVSCKTDLDTQRSELVCLLVPNIVKTSFNFRQQNILNR